MIGRYGPDHLNLAMIIVSIILGPVSRVLRFAPLMYASYLLLFLSVFRLLSRNITRRRAENDRFIRLWWPVKTKVKRFFSNIKNRKTHKFFKCPGCRNTLRVPRKKGKLQITCPKCGERFIKKT